MKTVLTKLQSFNAMTKFLDIYFDEIKSGSLAVLLSGMQFLIDEHTADPAYWYDWEKITGSKKSMSPLEAYEAMIKFLKINLVMSEDDELLSSAQSDETAKAIDSGILNEYSDSKKAAEFFSNIQPSNGKIINQNVWKRWMECVNKTLDEPEETRSYLTLNK